MALNLTRGNQTTDNYSSSPDTRIRFVDPRIFFAQAEIAPITAVLTKLNRLVKASSVKPEWVEKDLGTPTTTVNGAIVAGDTSVVVAAGTGKMFSANDLIWIPSTGEQILVTAVSTDTLTISRAFGSTGAADIADGATVVLLASSYAENATSGQGVAISPEMPYNVMQIHRTPIDMSRSFLQTGNYNYKNKIADQRKDAMIVHLEKLERQILVGELKWDTSNHRRASKGINSFLTTNREDMGGAFTKAKFDGFLKDVMFNGGGEYWCFASGSLMEALNSEVLSNSNMNITPATKEWGLDIRTYLSPFGRCKIAYHRTLSQIMETDFSGCGYVLNMNLLSKYYLQKMILKENIQTNDTDGRKDEYLEECCLGVANEANHGFLYNV